MKPMLFVVKGGTAVQHGSTSEVPRRLRSAIMITWWVAATGAVAVAAYAGYTAARMAFRTSAIPAVMAAEPLLDAPVRATEIALGTGAPSAVVIPSLRLPTR